MKIIDKFKMKAENRETAPSVTIAFLGDSVTEGCFDVYKDEKGGIGTYVDIDSVYHTKVKKIFSKLYPTAPLNIINAGVSGNTSWAALERMEKDVISHGPDLCVVAFGGNDAFVADGSEEKFADSLAKIFDRLLDKGIEVIFMTEHMMCRRVSCHLSEPMLIETAKGVAEREVDGRFKSFMEAGKKVAKEKNIPVCDIYAKWEKMHEGGVDTTSLLANHINHPDEDMHWLFAYSLVETMFNE